MMKEQLNLTNRFIVCNYNMFDANQTIFISSRNNNLEMVGTSNSLELGKWLSYYCKKWNLNEIRLFGPESALTKVVSDINYHNTKYNINNLRVIVNNKKEKN